MAGGNGVFNIARGKLAYYYYAVKQDLAVTATGTPPYTSTANSALIIVLLETAGLEADATLRDYDDLLTLIAGPSNEQVNQARKVLTNVELAAVPAPDDVNDRLLLAIPNLTYTALGGNAIGKVLVCFDNDTTLGTDSNIIPLTFHGVTHTPDGNDAVLNIDPLGFYRSS